jgi:hypothetical protein
MARRSSSTLKRGEVESDETGNKEAAGEHAGLLKIADVSPTPQGGNMGSRHVTC